MKAILFLAFALLIKKIFNNNTNISTEAAINSKNETGKLKNLAALKPKIKRPARILYMMDHGISMYHTHEYCYLHYLQMELESSKFNTAGTFNNYSLTFSRPMVQVPPDIIKAAKSYLSDRAEYLGFLN